MGVKWLFAAIFSVLFRPDAFWREARERLRELNAMKEYAAPVIVIVQFVKLPFIGAPRMAMLLAVIGFTVDVAVLWLLSGALVSLAGSARSESIRQEIMTLLCFSLTPVWLVEPFGFAGAWRWLVMAAALVHALFIARIGMQTLLVSENLEIDAFFRKSAVLIATATMIAFLLQSGLIRFFTSF
jgi:hypothetical protein